jgi:hypothetical protein
MCKDGGPDPYTVSREIHTGLSMGRVEKDGAAPFQARVSCESDDRPFAEGGVRLIRDGTGANAGFT